MRVLLALGLLLGAGGWETLSRENSITPFPAIAKDAQTSPEETDLVIQKLIGQWQTIRPPAAEVSNAIFTFTSEGKLFILMAGASGETAVASMAYQIDSKRQPMHLDLTLSNRSDDQIKTIFDFTEEGLLRLQLSGINPSTPRPSAFSDPPLKKISNSPTIQPDVKDIAQKVRGKSKEMEGRLYVSSLIQAELAYYLENSQYASAIDQLGAGFQQETENYRYEIVSGEKNQWVGVRGVAKRLGLKSFVGAVFTATGKEGPFTLIAAICQTKEPTRLPPRLPDLITNEAGAEPRIRCREDTQPFP
ncbi:type IV pilin-like G/H family protein [Leptothermofonsia sp. ETS-13]|uniref:type IV pilin-like G/H family protein n=1 Tax=Leptothermofonsia sp. ETS-13 TaxID=3035696 RepID=UPI003BA22B0C